MLEKNHAGLTIEQVSLEFYSPDKKNKLEVIDEISIKVEEGEFVSIIGPSGCGKTSLLNLIAGFLPISQGTIIHKGSPITKPSPKRAMVFQSAALFPWLNVYDNVAYGLKRNKVEKSLIKDMVEEHLQMVGIEDFKEYTPSQLSGGMQQRVAFARTLILKPELLLLDEPFAALDAQTRIVMQELLQNIHKDYKITTLLVTHDVEEALFLADKVYVLSKRPAYVVKEVLVPFARPRNLITRTEHEFAQNKKELLELIREQTENYMLN